MKYNWTMKKIFIVQLILILASCTPTDYQFVRKNYDPGMYNISEVIIMVEFLDLKSQFNGSWSFDENRHLYNQDKLYNLTSTILKEKGYNVSDKMLKTSGIVMSRDVVAKHYFNGERQQYRISPPFIVRSTKLSNSDIQGLEELLAEIDMPVSPVMSDYKSYIKNNYIMQMPMISSEDNTAIMIIQSYQQKNLFPADWDIGFGVASSSLEFGFDSEMTQSASAYFIHKGTGDLIWSNKTNAIRENNLQEFFLMLPINSGTFQTPKVD